MTTDNESSRMYLSPLLKETPYANFCTQLEGILQEYQIEMDYLPHTRDIWCRDFMPVQVDKNTFVAYRYDPDYLQAKKYRKTKSYPDVIADEIGLQTIKTDIILDGGNIIRMKDFVVMTDKAVTENKPFYNKKELTEALKQLFKVKDILWIPWDKSEPFGHADGMVRTIDENRLLVHGYLAADPFFDPFFTQLKANGIGWELLSFGNPEPDSEENWIYLNYMQTKDLLLVPQIGTEHDRVALDRLKELFPAYAAANCIATIDVRPLLVEGGGLNCISWTVE
jgi:agmatine/peptidylarginine deiminase